MPLGPVGNGERVIGKLPNRLEPALKEIDDMHMEMEDLRYRAAKILEIANAKSTLFWEEVSHVNEVAESSNRRGMLLAVRENDGEIVIVEAKMQPTMHNVNDVMRRLLGM